MFYDVIYSKLIGNEWYCDIPNNVMENMRNFELSIIPANGLVPSYA